MNDRAPGALDLVVLAGLSAAMLAFEILLLRLFEFSHWHHFAGFALAIALLGLGSAGTVLALAGRRAVASGDGWFLGGLLIMAAGLIGVVWLQSVVALRPLFALTDAGQLARVLAVDLAAFIPFFGAGLAIGQVFLRWPQYAARLYSANLLGSAAGSVAAVAALTVLDMQAAIGLVVTLLLGLGLVAALVRRRKLAIAGCLALLIPGAGIVVNPPPAAVSDFKALARILELPGAGVETVQPGLRGRLTVVESPALRFAPGLSLNWTESVPAMDAAIIGSDRTIPLARDYRVPAAHLEASLAGLPLALRPHGPVLVAGFSTWSTPAGSGDLRITWVARDQRVFDHARRRGAGGMTLIADDPFRYLATTRDTYPLIVIDAAFDGGDAAGEDYLMTVDGLAVALERLAPAGLLAIPLTVDDPPRHGPRALATLGGALEQIGFERPGEHLAVVRGMQDMLILAGTRPLTAGDLEAIRAFAGRWRFDLVWLPGLRANQANRFHRLDEPVYFEAARALFAGRPLPAAATWFETAPATFERPYFWRSMRWSRVPELIDQQGQRGLTHLDWSLVLSAVAVVVSVVLGLVLILAPLGRLPRIRPPPGRLSVAGYFTALGLGYMLVELAILHRVILYLGEPVLAAAVVFAAFMAGSGIGSATAPRAGHAGAVGRIYLPLAAGLAVAGGGLWFSGMHLLEPAPAARIALVVALILPLAWAMGRPFPWGLMRLAGQRRWVPWAWGINGFASVVGAVSATLLSVHLGQLFTLGTGMACYLAAAAIAALWAERARAMAAPARAQ